MELEERLQTYAPVGRVRISAFESGWHAAIVLRRDDGVRAEIMAGFDSATPSEALDRLDQRLATVRRDLEEVAAQQAQGRLPARSDAPEGRVSEDIAAPDGGAQ